HEGKLIKEIDGERLENQLKKSLILKGKDTLAMKSILSKAGYKLSVEDKHSDGESSPPLEIYDADAVEAPEKVATLLVNSGHPPTLLKVEKEDLEMYFLRSIKENRGEC